jgi:MFS family permease
MTGHGDQMDRQRGLILAGHMMLAFVGGLLLGVLGSLLLGALDWSGNLFFLLAPLLLGIIGMLTAGPRTKRPALGLGIGWMSWFGVWLAVLVWASFHPQTISDCFHADPPCYPTTVSFWGAYVWLNLFVFIVFLSVGLVNVLVGAAITSIAASIATNIVQRAVRRRTAMPKSSL